MTIAQATIDVNAGQRYLRSLLGPQRVHRIVCSRRRSRQQHEAFRGACSDKNHERGVPR